MADILRRVLGVTIDTPEDRWARYEREFAGYERRHRAYEAKYKEWHRSTPWLREPKPPAPPQPPLSSRYCIVTIPTGGSNTVDARFGETKWAASRTTPVLIARKDEIYTDYWLYQETVWATTDHLLTPDDVLALLHEAENRRRLRLEKAHALQAMRDGVQSASLRQPIPSEVKLEVWRRDAGRCVACGSNRNLEFDHVIPLALGGSNSARNLQLLCEDCNRRKGASLG